MVAFIRDARPRLISRRPRPSRAVRACRFIAAGHLEGTVAMSVGTSRGALWLPSVASDIGV